jgi:hypothetical protein
MQKQKSVITETFIAPLLECCVRMTDLVDCSMGVK